MQSVLITNGGPHKSAKWAEATASHILDISEHIAGERRVGAIKLQAAIIDILEQHHRAVKHGERAKLSEPEGIARLAAEQHDPEDHVNVENVADEIIAAARGTPWEKDFTYPGQDADEGNPALGIDPKPAIAGFKELLMQLLASHFATNMNIERSWHADRNPNAPEAKEFCRRHRPSTPEA